MIKIRRLAAVAAMTVILGAAALAEEMTCICPVSQYVRIRVSASRNAGVWGQLHAGDTVDVQGVENGFLRINTEGHTAYVDCRYFEREDGAWYIIDANGRVAKRKSPGGEKTGWLNPGVRIQVMGWRYGADGGLWARVYGGAYVSGSYLKRE